MLCGTQFAPLAPTSTGSDLSFLAALNFPQQLYNPSLQLSASLQWALPVDRRPLLIACGKDESRSPQAHHVRGGSCKMTDPATAANAPSIAPARSTPSTCTCRAFCQSIRQRTVHMTPTHGGLHVHPPCHLKHGGSAHNSKSVSRRKELAHHDLEQQGDAGTRRADRQPRLRAEFRHSIQHHEPRHLPRAASRNICLISRACVWQGSCFSQAHFSASSPTHSRATLQFVTMR